METESQVESGTDALASDPIVGPLVTTYTLAITFCFMWSGALCAVWNWLIVPTTTLPEIEYPLAFGVILLLWLFECAWTSSGSRSGTTALLCMFFSPLLISLLAYTVRFAA